MKTWKVIFLVNEGSDETEARKTVAKKKFLTFVCDMVALSKI